MQDNENFVFCHTSLNRASYLKVSDDITVNRKYNSFSETTMYRISKFRIMHIKERHFQKKRFLVNFKCLVVNLSQMYFNC